jgi:hypothetical protein
MPPYPNLPALRADLTSDDPDARGSAYRAVYEADLEPSDVLAEDPDESVIDRLVGAEIIPEGRTADRPSSAEYQADIVALLEQIVSNTGGS